MGAKAVLEVDGQKLTRFAKGGGSYVSAGDPRLRFGLAGQVPGRLVITWPDGTEQRFDGLTRDRYYRIVRGQAQPTPLTGAPGN